MNSKATTPDALWRDVTVGDVVTLQRGFDITKAEQSDGPYPVISSSGPTSTHSSYKVRGPGVVIGRKGSLGGVYYSDTAFWPHDTTLWVKDFHFNDPKFVYYWLQTLGLGRYDVGASNPTLNRNHVHLLPATIPAVEAQHKIAAALSAYDDLIENNGRRIELLEEMAQRIYTEWFVDFHYPGHQDVPLVDSELGPIPSGWIPLPSSEALIINPKITIEREAVRPFIPMTSLSETSMHVAPIEERAGSSGSKFQNGDTLFARITPCLENGKTAYIRCLDEGAVASGSTEFIVLRSKRLCPEYAYLLARSDPFRSHAIKSMSGASGRQRVRESCFDSFLLPVPPENLLQSFAARVRPLFALSYSLFSANSILQATRYLLLPRLISGEIDVSDLDIAMPEVAA